MKDIKVTDVRVLSGDSAFLVDNGRTAVLYDTGFAFTGYRIAENIKKVLGDRPLDAILLSHSHYDHALGTPYILKSYPEAKVVAGEYAVGIFQKPSAKRVMRELDRKFADKCGVGQYEDLVDELKVDIAVSDGDTVGIGDMKFTAVALPGHTRCSFGFYLAEQKLLLSSETLGVFGDGGVIVPSYLIGYEITIKSFEKAQKLDIEQFVLPHYGLLDKEQSKNFLRDSKQLCIDVTCKICDILQSGGTKEEAFEYFRERFYHNCIKSAYPVDAMKLNTGIMIDVIERELCNK